MWKCHFKWNDAFSLAWSYFQTSVLCAATGLLTVAATVLLKLQDVLRVGVDFRDALLTFYLIDCPLSSQERWQNWILDTRPSFQNHQGTLVPCNTGVMESDRWELLVTTPPPPVSPQLAESHMGKSNVVSSVSGLHLFFPLTVRS